MSAKPNIRYLDFTNNFAMHPVSNDLGVMADVNCIKNSLKNLILTDKFERLTDPAIGTNVNRLLFDNATGQTAAVIQSYIKETVANYEKRVNLVDVIVTPDDVHNSIMITIKFTVSFLQGVQTVQFFLDRIR